MTTFTPCHRPAALFHVHERQSLLLERERVTVDGSAPDTDEEALHRDDIAATVTVLPVLKSLWPTSEYVPEGVRMIMSSSTCTLVGPTPGN